MTNRRSLEARLDKLEAQNAPKTAPVFKVVFFCTARNDDGTAFAVSSVSDLRGEFSYEVPESERVWKPTPNAATDAFDLCAFDDRLARASKAEEKGSVQ